MYVFHAVLVDRQEEEKTAILKKGAGVHLRQYVRTYVCLLPVRTSQQLFQVCYVVGCKLQLETSLCQKLL